MFNDNKVESNLIWSNLISSVQSDSVICRHKMLIPCQSVLFCSFQILVDSTIWDQVKNYFQTNSWMRPENNLSESLSSTNTNKLYLPFNDELKWDSGCIVFWRAAAVITTGTLQTRVLQVLSVPEETLQEDLLQACTASPNRSPNHIHMFAYHAEELLKCESLCSFPENYTTECLTVFESPTRRHRSNPASKMMLLLKHLFTEWKLSQHSYYKQENNGMNVESAFIPLFSCS